MLKRLRWMALGAAMGLGTSSWLQRRIRSRAARYAPGRLTRSLRRELRSALEEGRAAMREREDELRALGPRDATPRRDRPGAASG